MPFQPRDTIRARRLRNESTPAERRLWQYLSRSQRGVKFSRQMPVGPYFVDFLCREFDLVIELDGWSHDARHEYDRLRDDRMKAQGWTVLRFANRDVLTNIEGIIAVIDQAIAVLRAGRHGGDGVGLGGDAGPPRCD